MTACGFCVVAALSSQTSGRAVHLLLEDREVTAYGLHVQTARRRACAGDTRRRPIELRADRCECRRDAGDSKVPRCRRQDLRLRRTSRRSLRGDALEQRCADVGARDSERECAMATRQV